MSMMCSKGSCKAKRGMCGHEKMMMVIMLIAIPALGHYVFHWF